MHSPPASPAPVFISFGKVAALTGLSRGTLYNMVDRGELPPPVRLTTNRVAFRSSDVNEWLLAKIVQ